MDLPRASVKPACSPQTTSLRESACAPLARPPTGDSAVLPRYGTSERLPDDDRLSRRDREARSGRVRRRSGLRARLLQHATYNNHPAEHGLSEALGTAILNIWFAPGVSTLPIFWTVVGVNIFDLRVEPIGSGR